MTLYSPSFFSLMNSGRSMTIDGTYALAPKAGSVVHLLSCVHKIYGVPV